MRMRKCLFGFGLASAIALTATPAFAHECFIANRSAVGNTAVVAHSKAWFPITPEIIFGEFFGLEGDALTCAIDTWNSDDSLPDYLLVGGVQARGQDGVIMERNPNIATKAGDGRGVDHAEDVYGAAAAAIAGACSED